MLILSLGAALLASCGNRQDVESPAAGEVAIADTGAGGPAFAIEEIARFDEPWAIRFAPGSDVVLITGKRGELWGLDTGSNQRFAILGTPEVDHGGQGGLGDIAFLPGQEGPSLDGRILYLSWAEAGEEGKRGAAVGRAVLSCARIEECRIEGLRVIWRQFPKVSGRGHYSHRLRFSPDGRHLFIASGERQKMDPAQDLSNNLGKILRLLPDGSAPADNPLRGRDTPSHQIWSLGHRNILGMDWDEHGRLWEVEHGPAGGDELNLVRAGANYGWPLVSQGDHYDGTPIPRHESAPQFAAPALWWTPVIAPSDMLRYRGAMFPAWRGDLLITGLRSEALVRVRILGDKAQEVERFALGNRLRSLAEAPDGSILVLEDGKDARLLRLAARSSSGGAAH